MKRTKTGRVLSNAEIEALADEAERGYDVDSLTAGSRRHRKSLIPNDEYIQLLVESGPRQLGTLAFSLAVEVAALREQINAQGEALLSCLKWTGEDTNGAPWQCFNPEEVVNAVRRLREEHDDNLETVIRAEESESETIALREQIKTAQAILRENHGAERRLKEIRLWLET